MTSTNKKKVLNTVVVSLGCNCRRPRLSSVFNPKPKSKQTLPKYHKHQNLSYSSSTGNSSSSPYEYYQTNSTFSPYMSTTSSSSSSHPSAVDGFGRVGPKSVAVEKESNDPYVDFRQSMLQMIVENEIYSKDDLKELLNCFLQLNETSLHGTIIRVFTEIWNGFFFSGKPNFSSPGYHVRPKSYEY